MGWADILVLAVIFALAGLVVYYLVRRRKQGGCSGCAGCPYHAANHPHEMHCCQCEKGDNDSKHAN